MGGYAWGPGTLDVGRRIAAKKPKPVVNPYDDPYSKATSDLIAAVSAPPSEQFNDVDLEYRTLLEGGPDYSTVPQWSQEDIDAAARLYADETADWAAKPLREQLERTKELYDFSAAMGTNFGQAIASVFSGGNTTEEAAQAFAENKFGSKYAIGAAVQAIGYELMARISAGFTERHFQIADRIAEIYAQRPDIMRERQEFLMQQIKDARSEADLSWSQRVEALGMLRVALQENEDRRIERLGSKREILGGERSRWAEEYAAKNAAAPAPNIEHIEGFGYVVWNGKDFEKVWDEPEDPVEAASLSQFNSLVNTALTRASKDYAANRKAGMSHKQALALERKELLAYADALAGVDPVAAAQIRAYFARWEPGRFTPEKDDAPERWSQPYKLGNRWVQKNLVTNEVRNIGSIPAPKDRYGPVYINKKTGDWEQKNLTTGKVTVVRRADSPPAKPPKGLSTIANSAYSLAQKLLKGGQGGHQVANQLKREYGGQLRKKGMNAKKINVFVYTLIKAAREGKDADDALDAALNAAIARGEEQG